MTRLLVCNSLLAWLLVAGFAAISASMYFLEQWYLENIFIITDYHQRLIRFGTGLTAAAIALALLLRPLLARMCVGRTGRMKTATSGGGGRGVVRVMGMHFCVATPERLSAGEVVRITGIGKGGMLQVEAPGRKAANAALATRMAGARGHRKSFSQFAPPRRTPPPQPRTNGEPAPPSPQPPRPFDAPARPPLFGARRGARMSPSAPMQPVPWSPPMPAAIRERPEYAYVWISNLPLHAPVPPLRNDVGGRVGRSRAAECHRLTEYEGKPTPEDCIVREAYGDDEVGFVEKLPHTFSLNGHITISRKVLDLFANFNLGDAEIFPVKIFQKDRKTPVKGEFFVINPYRNRKMILLPEQSRPKVLDGPHDGIYGDFWSFHKLPADGDIAVSADALDAGADIWVDPRLLNTLFLSAALGDALRREGLARGWRPRKARVMIDDRNA